MPDTLFLFSEDLKLKSLNPKKKLIKEIAISIIEIVFTQSNPFNIYFYTKIITFYFLKNKKIII